MLWSEQDYQFCGISRDFRKWIKHLSSKRFRGSNPRSSDHFHGRRVPWLPPSLQHPKSFRVVVTGFLLFLCLADTRVYRTCYFRRGYEHKLYRVQNLHVETRQNKQGDTCFLEKKSNTFVPIQREDCGECTYTSHDTIRYSLAMVRVNKQPMWTVVTSDHELQTFRKGDWTGCIPPIGTPLN